MDNIKLFDDHYKNICSEKTLQSNEKGFFLDFADFLAAEAGEAWINNTFGKLKSDKNRIKCIYEYEKTRVPLENFLSNVQEIYRKKDARISRDKRLEAEKLFENENFQQALQLFSLSVLRAPKQGVDLNIDDGLSLPLALFGRSLTLLELKEYNLALSDIQESLKEGLPTKYKAKCFWKMGICYQHLNDDTRANVSFDLAKKMLNDPEELKRLDEDRTKKVECNSQIKIKDTTDLADPNLLYVSDKIVVKKSPEFGKYTAAKKPINTGDTLVVEPPNAAVLSPKMAGTNCHHCFQRLVAPVGCSDCSNVAFCKIQCRNEAIDTYHKFECKYLDLLVGSGMSICAHIALRIIAKNSLEKTLEIYKNRKLESIHLLCTNAHMRKPSDFLQRTAMTCFLLRCLQKAGYFGQNENKERISPSEQEICVAELILFNLQMLQFNAHEVYETRTHPDHPFKGSKTVYLGVGIYPNVSLFNHGCLPAVTRHFVGKNIVIRASRPLQPDESVAENYGPIFTHKRFQDRQIWLSSRYWFTCKCQACTGNWPSLDNGLDTISKRLKCPTKNCKNVFTLPVSSEILTCPKCQKEVILTDRILLLKWCEDQYEIAFKYFREGSVKAIDMLCLTLDTFYKISCPPHRDTHLAEATLRACFATSGNTAETLVKSEGKKTQKNS